MIRIQTQKGTGLVRKTKKLVQDYLTHNPAFSSLQVKEHMNDGMLEIDTKNQELSSILQTYLDRKFTSNTPKVQFIHEEKPQPKISIPDVSLEIKDGLERKVQELTGENQRLKAEYGMFKYGNTAEDFNKAQLILYKHSQAPRFRGIVEKFNDGFSLVEGSMTQDDLIKLVMSKDVPFEKSEKYRQMADRFKRAERALELLGDNPELLNVDEINKILAERDKLKKSYEDATAEIDLIKDVLKDETVPYLLTLKQSQEDYTITITTPLEFRTKENSSTLNFEGSNEFELSFLNYVNKILNEHKDKNKASISVHNTNSLVSLEFKTARRAKNAKDLLEEIAKDIIGEQESTLFYNLGVKAHVITPLTSFVDGYTAGIFKKSLARRLKVSSAEGMPKRTVTEPDFGDYMPLISYGLKQGLPQGFESKISKKPGHVPSKISVAIVASLGKKGERKTPEELRAYLSAEFGFKFGRQEERLRLNNTLTNLTSKGILIKEGYLRESRYYLNPKVFY